MNDSKSVTLFTKEEAAIKLRISVSTINTWLAQKKIGYTKVGARVLFSQEDLERIETKNHAA
jgi:excisionase family DNA binding protein